VDTTTKENYVNILRKRYLNAPRKKKTQILNEMQENIGMHRKSAIRCLHSFRSRKKPLTRPPRYLYTKKTLWIIEELWALNEYACGTNLKEAIPIWLPHLKKYFPINQETEKQLTNISPSTIDRRLKEKRKKHKLKLYNTTKPHRPLYSEVPVKTISRGIVTPGSIEIDTVVHCGGSYDGDMCYTVNAVDLALGWIGRRAVFCKGARGVHNAITEIIAEMPFLITHIDIDNGDEFLNWHMINFCKEHNITLTRCRPYKKNDQAHIEQKNSTHVRRIFGRTRFDTPSVRDLLNDLYQHELMLYHNFFRPSQKLIEKTFLASKTKRIFDTPQTPFQRLLLSPHVSQDTKDRLSKLFASLDPVELKKTINNKIKGIFNEQKRNPLHKTA
jgi:hypothetical protein